MRERYLRSESPHAIGEAERFRRALEQITRHELTPLEVNDPLGYAVQRRYEDYLTLKQIAADALEGGRR